MTTVALQMPFLVPSMDEGLDAIKTGVGKESQEMRDRYSEYFKDAIFPISRSSDFPKHRFLSLKFQWEHDTALMSSISEMVMHPAYQRIIGMGEKAIPFIMNELKTNGGHWFWALKSISGEDPVLPEYRGNIEEMTKAWLKWGEDKGYI